MSNCEIVGKTTAPILKTLLDNTVCLRLIPMISYVWSPASSTDKLDKFTAFYRMDFENFAPGARGLAKFGGSAPQFLGPELTEVQFNAVRGGNKGDIDNIHDFLKNKGLFVPGYRASVFDCFHMHWRWSPNQADVFSNQRMTIRFRNPLLVILTWYRAKRLISGL